MARAVAWVDARIDSAVSYGDKKAAYWRPTVAYFPLPGKKYSSTLKPYRALSTTNLGVRYTESKFFSSPSRPCHSGKQSFINKAGVKLISPIHIFHAPQAFKSQ